MTEVEHRPARLDVTVGLGDDVVLPVAVQTGDGTPVDISGWTLEGDGVAVTVVDGSGGLAQLDFSGTESSRPVEWTLSRSTPNTRRLLAGRLLATTHGTSEPTSGSEIVLQVTDTAVTVEVGDVVDAVARGLITDHTADHPSSLPDGGADGDVLTKQSGEDGDADWEAPGAASHPDLATHDSLGLATDAELAAHSDATSGVHGVGASAVESTSGAQAKADAAEAAAQGYADTEIEAHRTGEVHVAAQPPQTHAASHATAGGDPIAPSDIGAEDDGAAAAAVSAHEGAADPHTGYRLESDSPVDPVAGTAGLRTLGTGGQQAAAGDHGHSDAVTSADVTTIDVVTQAAYDALDPPDANTLYVVVG